MNAPAHLPCRAVPQTCEDGGECEMMNRMSGQKTSAHDYMRNPDCLLDLLSEGHSVQGQMYLEGVPCRQSEAKEALCSAAATWTSSGLSHQCIS